MSNSVHVSTKSKQVQVTPFDFLGMVRKRFGVLLALDLACTDENKRCRLGITEAENSLSVSWFEKIKPISEEEGFWSDKTVCAWLNPPFKGVAPWMQKCGDESAKGMKIISLTLASLGTGWYRNYVEGKALSLILRDRIVFEGEKDPFPKELMVSLWGFGMTGLGFWSWKPPTDQRKPSLGASGDATTMPGQEEKNMNDEQTTETMIQKAGSTGRRLSPADIDRVIAGETFTVLPNGLTTICQLTLANGYTVTGESACVSPENYNKEIGEKVARENARQKIWSLEGYRLKEACFRGRDLESYETPETLPTPESSEA